MLLGEGTPGGFLAETAVRALVVYLVLLVCMRVMGKRTTSQLSLAELAVVITLGAAIGVPMQVPERGLLPGIIVLGVIVLVQRGINHLASRRGKIQNLVEGTLTVVLRDGVLDLKALHSLSLPRETLCAVLRGHGIEQLGEVRRVYLERSGQFSVLRAEPARAGLSIIPPRDTSQLMENAPAQWACESCGRVVRQVNPPTVPCGACHRQEWTHALQKRSPDQLQPPQYELGAAPH